MKGHELEKGEEIPQQQPEEHAKGELDLRAPGVHAHAEREKREFRYVQSEIWGPDKKRPEIKLAIMTDGTLRRVNFFDIDYTLVEANDLIHGEAIKRMFPDHPPEEVKRVWNFGGKLGSSVREWDRMLRVMEDGRSDLETMEAYRREVLQKPESRIEVDTPGEKYHDRAEKWAAGYDLTAFQMLKDIYEHRPEILRTPPFLNEAVVHLLQVKQKKLHEANVFITSAGPKMAYGLLEYTGLYQYGIAVATENEFKGGGKERGIPWLIDKLEIGMKLPVPKSHLVIIGDSIHGDIGAAARFMDQQMGYHFEGAVYVQKNKSEAQLFADAARSDEELAALLNRLPSLQILTKHEFRRSRAGSPLLGKKSGDHFPLRQKMEE